MLSSQSRSASRFTDLVLMTLALGAVWGFSEVVLGNFLRTTSFQFSSALLTGIGMGTIAVAISSRKPLYSLLGIVLIAIVIKQLGVPLLGASVMCKANSCLAVGLEAGGLGSMAIILNQKMERGVFARIMVPASGAILAALAFWTIGRHVAPCNYLLSFSNPGSFLLKEGLPWAVFSAALFPVGWQIGQWLHTSNVLIPDAARSISLAAIAVAGFSASAISIMYAG